MIKKECKHCVGSYGKDIEVKQSPGDPLTQPTKIKIINIEGDTPGMVLFRWGLAQGYFDISYCPMCGRKL